MNNQATVSAIFFALRDSPVGSIGVAVKENALLRVAIHPDPEVIHQRFLELWPHAQVAEKGLAQDALRQINEFFRGDRRSFDLPLDFGQLSPFSVMVLQKLRALPFGERITYGRLAALVGRPAAARAIGRVMACNPFPIVIPCHRVVGAGNKMTGYSGGEGIATKECLLHFEQGRMVS